MARRRDFRIGLDIGSNCIKMVSYHLDSTKTSRLARLWLADLIAEETIKRPMDASETLFEETLAGWIEGTPYKKASVRLCLSASEGNLFVVTIPQVGLEDLENTLFWELRPLLSQSVENYRYVYQVLSRERKQMTLLVGLYEKKRLERVLRILKKVGIRPDVVETDTLAAVDLFLKELDEIDKPLGFLQLGANHSSYAILSPDAHPRFLFIPFGGNKLTEITAKDKGIPFSKAESVRRAAGEKQRKKRKKQSGDVQHIDEMIGDLSRTIVRFNAHYREKTGQKLSKIYMTGGLLNDPVIAEAVSISPSSFRVPSEFWDPLENYFPQELIEPHYSYHFASALGLALR